MNHADTHYHDAQDSGNLGKVMGELMIKLRPHIIIHCGAVDAVKAVQKKLLPPKNFGLLDSVKSLKDIFILLGH